MLAVRHFGSHAPHPAFGPTPQAGFPPLPAGEGKSFSHWEKVPPGPRNGVGG
jgi:hypothetical protein